MLSGTLPENLGILIKKGGHKNETQTVEKGIQKFASYLIYYRNPSERVVNEKVLWCGIKI